MSFQKRRRNVWYCKRTTLLERTSLWEFILDTVSTPFQTGQFWVPSESALSTTSSFQDAQEVEQLLSIVSPQHTCAHTPETWFQSLILQIMSTTMDITMLGDTGLSSKGKQPEHPKPRGQTRSSSPYHIPFNPPPAGGSSGYRGGWGPNPGSAVRPPSLKPQKKHIKKPEDFVDMNDWDTFKQQEFLYYEEYQSEFSSDVTLLIRSSNQWYLNEGHFLISEEDVRKLLGTQTRKLMLKINSCSFDREEKWWKNSSRKLTS